MLSPDRPTAVGFQALLVRDYNVTCLIQEAMMSDSLPEASQNLYGRPAHEERLPGRTLRPLPKSAARSPLNTHWLLGPSTSARAKLLSLQQWACAAYPACLFLNLWASYGSPVLAAYLNIVTDWPVDCKGFTLSFQLVAARLSHAGDAGHKTLHEEGWGEAMLKPAARMRSYFAECRSRCIVGT